MSSSFDSSPLAEFAAGLFSSGQVIVRRDPELAKDSGPAQRLLEEAFSAAVMELADGGDAALEFVPGIGLESLRFLYRICLVLSDRSMGDAEVHGICGAMPPAPTTPAEMLSADVSLRHLPEIHQMARAVSQDDPLLTGLAQAAARFPLSSVGIELENAPDLTLLHRHVGLWQLYMDRVLERQDVSRTADPAVRAALLDAIGLHRGLAPKLASCLALAAG